LKKQLKSIKIKKLTYIWFLNTIIFVKQAIVLFNPVR